MPARACGCGACGCGQILGRDASAGGKAGQRGTVCDGSAFAGKARVRCGVARGRPGGECLFPSEGHEVVLARAACRGKRRGKRGKFIRDRAGPRPRGVKAGGIAVGNHAGQPRERGKRLGILGAPRHAGRPPADPRARSRIRSAKRIAAATARKCSGRTGAPISTVA